MSYLDIHAHFAEEGYDFPAEWERIAAAGVDTVVLAGDSVPHCELHRDFCETHAGAFFCAGVHPSVTGDFSEETLSALRALAKDERCVAVGEIGLDYHYPEDTDKPRQREAFIRQLALADELGLPMQIHSRDAYADTVEILRAHRDKLQRGFLLHCYSYSEEAMGEILSLGGYFSFGGVTCFKNANRVLDCVRACPQDRILTETDSPYLSPFRGEKNTPANIPVIAAKIAGLRGVSVEELNAQVAANAARLFPKLRPM